MTFLDLNDRFRGQPARLLSSLNNNSPGQSYIIHGDSINEVNQFTNEWVKTLACQNRNREGACGACRHCLLLDSGNYPEMYKLAPASKSRTILVDALRQFQNSFYMKAPAGVKKIGVIIEADRMQVQAQNAFLKTLEEPPPNTFLILLTTRQNGLLDTIRSRCRNIFLATNKTHYDPELQENLVQILSGLCGQDGAAVSMEVQDRILEIFTTLKKKAQMEIEADYKISEQEAEDAQLRKRFKEKIIVLVEGRYKLYREQILSMLEVWTSQNYLLANGVDLSTLSHADLVSEGWSCTTEASANALKLVEQLKYDLAANVSEDLAIENFFLQICQK